jgi:alkanesulfonate monooxygenase SsuD/methylene tetrahydromethanopterin reductase-like flavin-dependent oxidoreductase (luciferase family)
MGSREQNFYNALAVRMGFEQAAAEIQHRYLSRDYAGAAAAVPQEFIDATSLLGPVERIADRMQALADSGVTTVSLAPYAGTLEEGVETMRGAVAALERAGLAE